MTLRQKLLPPLKLSLPAVPLLALPPLSSICPFCVCLHVNSLPHGRLPPSIPVEPFLVAARNIYLQLLLQSAVQTDPVHTASTYSGHQLVTEATHSLLRISSSYNPPHANPLPVEAMLLIRNSSSFPSLADAVTHHVYIHLTFPYTLTRSTTHQR